MAKRKKPKPSRNVKRPTRKAPVKKARRAATGKTGGTSRKGKGKVKSPSRRLVRKVVKLSTRRPKQKNRNRKGGATAKGKVSRRRLQSPGKTVSRKVSKVVLVRKVKDEAFHISKDYRRNRTKIKLGKGKFKKKFDALTGADVGNLTKVFLERNKQADGFIKLPRAAVVTFTAYVKGKPNYRTKMTPPDMVINEENLNAFISAEMESLGNDWLERDEMEEEGESDLLNKSDKGAPDETRNYNRTFNADKIAEVSIRFIY